VVRPERRGVLTGLRIGDVARLTRDRITKEGQRFRIFLRTEKTGKPVFLPIPEEMRLALNALPVPRGAPPDCRWYFWNGRPSERALVGIAERTLAAGRPGCRGGCHLRTGHVDWGPD
jgi:hypothetical protein